jgi:hypothetical protein
MRSSPIAVAASSPSLMSACVSSADQTRLDGVGCPDARVAVRLELGPDRTALGALGVAADALEDAELVLYVVAVLVRDHVGLGERPAACAEARLQLVEEA